MNLYHYCSNRSLLSILESNSIWLSDFSLSNDLLEGRWVRTVFASYCERKGLKQNQIDDLLRHLDGLIKIVGAAGFCLSEQGDLLSQWRGYADNGAGVSIGFDRLYLSEISALVIDDEEREFGLSLKKVEYDTTEQEKSISSVADKILSYVEQGALLSPTVLTPDDEIKKHKQAYTSLSISFLLFLEYLYTFKNPAFSEEREWRLMSILTKGIREDDPVSLKKLGYRSVGEKIIPYVSVELAKTEKAPIIEIILGPRNPVQPLIIYGLLHKYGHDAVKVRRSSASYR